MPIQLNEEGGGRILVIQVSGTLEAADFALFVPEFDRLVKLHGKLRVLFDMTAFHGWEAGAVWEDLKFGAGHYADIERLAMVGETQWQHGMATFCRAFTNAATRYFDQADAAAARAWLSEAWLLGPPPTLENSQPLLDVAHALVAGHKGILAMDESTPTCNRRFAALGIPQTAAARRDYRELLVTTPGLAESISGAILCEETIHQQLTDGTPFATAVGALGILPGIKVDAGAQELAGHPGQKVTEGLDGLRDRLAGHAQLGARFAKWRAVIVVGEGLPSQGCLEANAHALARYAALCQEAGLVPVVEPEVLMDGEHTLERCREVTELLLRQVFSQLATQRVLLEGTILKCNMVVAGLACPVQPTIDEVADATVETLLRVVPEAVPGIAFLSGGQSAQLASARLNAMNVTFKARLPWALAFSFARAIQQPALELWRGDPAHVPAAQQALLHRARCNRAARLGCYDAALEAGSGGSHQPRLTEAPVLVYDAEGQPAGVFERREDSRDGAMVLITREPALGGGTIAVPGREVTWSEQAWHLPYGELSLREAPPYSPHVALHAYFEYWERLGAGNVASSMAEYLSTGSGPVESPAEVADQPLQAAVTAALRDPAGGAAFPMVRVTVSQGTVLLEGYQSDTPGRLAAAAAAAAVPGVKEIVNMLVIRAL